MKRFYTLFLTLGLLTALAVPASGASRNGVRITVDGVPLETEAAYISEGGTTMVPLRAIAEALGCEVRWDPDTRTASILSPAPVLPGETAAFSSALVVLDPGHGGEYNGAEYGGVQEKNLNLSIATQVASLLEAEGVTVQMTRRADQDVDLYARTDFANGLGADLFVSVHCNANVDHDDAVGIYTCAYGEDTEGWQLAQLLHDAMIASTGAADFGMEERPNLAVLRTSEMPAALVECGFMSTPEELALLVQPEYQARLARGIADGILAYLAQ